MVLNKIICVLESYGFDTYIGFLHSIKYGRQSLDLNILEEFRQGFCYNFVIKLLNREEFNIREYNNYLKKHKHLTPTSNSILIYPLCTKCLSKEIVLGSKLANEKEITRTVFII